MLKLSEISLFKFVSPEDAERIAAKALVIRKQAGEAVVLHAEDVLGIYVIDSGVVGVYASQAKQPFNRISQGGAFGEMSFLENTKASATIRIETQGTELRLFQRSLLSEVIAAHPSLGSALYRGIALSLSQKVRTTNERISREVARTKELLKNMNVLATSEDAIVFEQVNKELHKQIEQSLAVGAKLADNLMAMDSRAKNIGSALADARQEAEELTRGTKKVFAELTLRMRQMQKFIEFVEGSVLLSAGDLS